MATMLNDLKHGLIGNRYHYHGEFVAEVKDVDSFYRGYALVCDLIDKKTGRTIKTNHRVYCDRHPAHDLIRLTPDEVHSLGIIRGGVPRTAEGELAQSV